MKKCILFVLCVGTLTACAGLEYDKETGDLLLGDGTSVPVGDAVEKGLGWLETLSVVTGVGVLGVAANAGRKVLGRPKPPVA